MSIDLWDKSDGDVVTKIDCDTDGCIYSCSESLASDLDRCPLCKQPFRRGDA